MGVAPVCWSWRPYAITTSGSEKALKISAKVFLFAGIASCVKNTIISQSAKCSAAHWRVPPWLNWDRSIQTTSKPAERARVAVSSVEDESMISILCGRKLCMLIADKHAVHPAPALSVGITNPTRGALFEMFNVSSGSWTVLTTQILRRFARR
jgi:hypothetical protein